MIQYIRNILCILILLFSFTFLIGQVHYEQYTDLDGLPSMTTYNIVQDSSGLLWIGTENGLVSYDGVEFVTHEIPGLFDNDIIELEIDKDGNLYMLNLSNQLIVRSKDIFIVKDLNNKYQKFIYSQMHNTYLIVKNKDVSASKREVYKISILNDSIDLKLQYDNYISIINKSLFVDKNRTIDTFFYFDEGPLVFECRFENFAIFFDQHGERYFWDRRKSRLIKLSDSDFRKTLLSTFNNFYELSKYEKYISLGTELYTADNQLLIENIIINAVIKDKENNLWISSGGQGLFKIESKYILELLKGQYLDFMFFGFNKLVLQNDKLLVQNPDNKYEIILPTTRTKPKLIDSDSTIFVLSDKEIILIPKYQQFKSNTFEIESIKSLLVHNDSIIVYGPYQIKTLDSNGHLKSFLRFPYRVYDIELFNGRIYLGTTNGLYILENGSVELIPYTSNLNISDLFTIDSTELWVATINKGLHLINNGEICNKISEAEIDQFSRLNEYKGELYALTDKGIARYDTVNNQYKILSQFDGFPGSNFTFYTIHKDTIYIGTSENVLAAELDIFDQEYHLNPVHLKSISVNNTRQKAFKYSYSYNQNNINLNYQFVSFRSGKDKKLKYRIAEIDTNYITTNSFEVRLPSMKPGKYTIEAIGITSNGLESKPHFYSFTIHPPWWQTWWARSLSVLIVFGGIYTYVKNRDRNIRKEEERKREVAQQINVVKDQALQLQMNPHFIFNAMNAIQNYIGSSNEQKAINYLARFARLIRMIFEYSKGSTITLAHELEFIRLYMDLEKLRFQNKVDVTLDVDEELLENDDIINIPPLLIQPIIENSFKHGIFHLKDRKGKVIVKYDLSDENTLRVTVQDNGIGREASEKKKNLSKLNKSSGIKNTQERIRILNESQNSNKNKINIEDLINDDGDSIGTKTIIDLDISTR